MPYLGKSPSQGVRNRYYYTVASGATSVSGSDDNSNTLIFADGEYVDVYLNGVLLVAGTDYNTSTANTIASLSAMSANDVVEVIVYDTFSVFSGNVNSNFSVGGDATVAGTTSLTGKVGIGIATASEMLEVFNDTSPAIQLNDGGDFQAKFALVGNDLEIRGSSGVMEFYTGNADGASSTKRMTLNASGAVDMTSTLAVAGAIAVGQSSLSGGSVIADFHTSGSGVGTQLAFANDHNTDKFFVGLAGNTSGNAFLYQQKNANIEFYTNNSLRATLDNNGKLGIGTSSPDGLLTILTGNSDTVPRLRFQHPSTTDDASIDTFQDANGTVLGIGTNAFIANNSAPTKFNTSNEAALMRFFYEGIISFATADASTDLTERMTIDNSGVAVVTSTGWDKVFDNSDTNVTGIQLHPTGAIGMQLDKNGTGTEGIVINNIHSASATTMCLQYRTQQTIEGSVQGNGSGLSFVNVSDYRKKENITDLSGSLAKIKALRPVTFTHKSAYTTDTSAVKTGMIAHEVAEVLPNLVVGEKDAVDDNGDIVLQALSYSGDEMITNLIGAIKELEARIATLEG